MKFYDSAAALALDMGVFVSKMEESIAAHSQASSENIPGSGWRTIPSVSWRQVLGRSSWQDGFRKVPPQHRRREARAAELEAIAGECESLNRGGCS